MLRTLASRWNKEKFRCYEAQIEESEKAGSRRESNPGHPACAASALPLSYDNRTTTTPHNPLYVLHRWGCRCHSGSDPPENPIRAGSDMLAVSILPQRIRSGVSTVPYGSFCLHLIVNDVISVNIHADLT